MIDLGPRGRLLFAVSYLVAQAALVITAYGRPEHAFGFQMFSESSYMTIHLEREVPGMSGHDTMLVDVNNGEWTARDHDGIVHHYAWRDRVKDPIVGSLDVEVPAAYGALAQLTRLQAALDDVATHLPGDGETKALVAHVALRKNGTPSEKTLKSVER